MKVYIIPKGTKIELGNGDGNLTVATTIEELNFIDPTTDPIYYHNNRNNKNIMNRLNEDLTIKEKGNKVVKIHTETLEMSNRVSRKALDIEYEYIYINYKDIIKFYAKSLCTRYVL